MKEFELNTDINRLITVGPSQVNDSGVCLTTEEVDVYPATLIHSKLTTEQTRQLAQALLDSADEIDGVKPQSATDELNARIAELESRLAEYEPEQLYYIKVLDNGFGYLNLDVFDGGVLVNTRKETNCLKAKFTQSEIDGNPELKKLEQFKIRVEED